MIFVLVSNMGEAIKIVKAAKAHHLAVRNFDRVESFLNNMKESTPSLVILDFDSCEAKSFEILKALRSNVDYNKVPAVGFVTQAKIALKSEGERAGCLKVYTKAEFARVLNDLMVRFAK